jgi:hypothetical protein
MLCLPFPKVVCTSAHPMDVMARTLSEHYRLGNSTWQTSSSFSIGAEDGGNCLRLGGLTWRVSDDFSIGDWEHLLACSWQPAVTSALAIKSDESIPAWALLGRPR